MMDRGRMGALLAVLLSLFLGCGDDDNSHPAATATATRTVSPTPFPTGTPTATVTCACTPTATGTATATPPLAPTLTPTPRLPEITYFGIARADDLALTPTFFDDQDRPVFDRVQGQGMMVVLEARRGAHPLGRSAYDQGGGLRGVDFLVSRPLGNGSRTVCDLDPPGGVPGIDPPVFSDAPEVTDAIDDLGCRVNDGTGAPSARLAGSACTLVPPTIEYRFVDSTSDLQYCLPIAKAWNFPVGDTIVAARVRDITGAVSAVSEIVVRVEREQPFTCGQGLGERDVVIQRPPSRLVTSASGNADASTDPWLTGTLRLCAGTEIGDGIHTLNLREDAVLGLALTDGETLCVQVSARGSSGSVDCDGGSPADVRASQDPDGLTRIAVDAGLGVDAGTGAAIILAPISVLFLPPGAAPSDCQTAEYPPAFNGALTTATGTAQVVTLGGTVVAESSAAGTSFDCSTWQSGGTGAFVLPFPAVNRATGDLAAVLQLSE